MRRAGSQVLLGLLLASVAAGGQPATCGVQKGLYDDWLALSKRAGPFTGLKAGLMRNSTAGAPDAQRQLSAGEEYQSIFQCLSDTAEKLDQETIRPFCAGTAGDRLASLVCQVVIHIKTGRTASKDFLDAVPTGKKGAEMIWDLEAIAAAGQEKSHTPAMFLPNGPAFRLIDELFLLVLDGKETAAGKYFNLSAYASDAGAKHMDEQIKVLLLESPAVVVKEWAVLRQYQPKLKKLLAEMAASLPPAEMLKMRRGVAGFCPKDNLDCPEILKLFGRPE